MDAALRAGVALYNAGRRRAAHDPWEAPWLDLPDGSDDERFLHGLIQFTAAVFHAERGEWAGATGLATSALDYLAGLGETYRGVDLGPVRAYLRRLAADPETVERVRPPPLRHGGRAVVLDDLDAEAAMHAAAAIADADDRFDADVIATAADYAREELDARGGGRFLALVMDFACAEGDGGGAGDDRAVVYARLREHVERRRRHDRDVDGLFE